MTQPQIIVGGNAGFHNANPKGRPYRDLSTVCIVPTRGMIPARAVEAFMGLQPPMNQKFTRIFISGMEVGEAYNAGIDLILNHPELEKWKYVLTLEEDNLPPPDGLLKLLDVLAGDEGRHLDAVGGLYFTKGEGGQPMCYGPPGGVMGFAPFLPDPETLTECNGLGLGFTLMRLSMFRDERIERPWFKTLQTYDPHTGVQAMTQDLYFFQKARAAGHRVACDPRVRVGHLDMGDGRVW